MFLLQYRNIDFLFVLNVTSGGISSVYNRVHTILNFLEITTPRLPTGCCATLDLTTQDYALKGLTIS